MANNAGKMFKLKSADGEEFVVPAAVAMQFQKIRNLIVDDCAQNAVPLPGINSSTLGKVIQYCSMHVGMTEKATEQGSSSAETANAMSPAEELKNWDAEFVKTDTTTLISLINAAHSLGIETLLDLTSRKMADIIMEKRSPEAIRRTLNIKNDYSPEEEEEIRRQSHWVFEDEDIN